MPMAGSTVARRARAEALLGPAFVASVAYVDPGNVATNVTAGAEYGYLLVWVVVAANLMACVVQYLSAKLGLVTGLSLPEVLRDRMLRVGRVAYWGQAELVAMATDLAEVLGDRVEHSVRNAYVARRVDHLGGVRRVVGDPESPGSTVLRADHHRHARGHLPGLCRWAVRVRRRRCRTASAGCNRRSTVLAACCWPWRCWARP